MSSPVMAAAAATPADAPPSSTPEKLVTVQIDSVPRGAEVRVHGQLLGVTPTEARLPPGDHEMVTSYHGWPETHQPIHLDAGQTRVSVEIPLMPPGLVPLNGPMFAPAQRPPPLPSSDVPPAPDPCA